MNLEEYLEEDEYFTDVPDCISSGEDYKELIEKSFLLTDGLLVLEDFTTSTSGGKFHLELMVNNNSIAADIGIISDYVNGTDFIELLNKIILEIAPASDGKFYTLTEDYADFGIAFLNKEKSIELMSAYVVR